MGYGNNLIISRLFTILLKLMANLIFFIYLFINFFFINSARGPVSLHVHIYMRGNVRSSADDGAVYGIAFLT